MRSVALATAPDTDEAALVAGARRGDEAAIRAIIRIHNQSLFRLARGILADDEAEDALQEGYLRAFRGIAEFRGEASLRTWLGRIVVNAARERLRRRRKTVHLNAEDVIAFPRTAAGGDPEAKMAQDQVRKLLEAAIDELPSAFRSVAVARLIEEMSVEETATVLDLRPETVKTRLHRARRLLQAAVERRLGAVMTEAFPFGDQRCQRVADHVIEGLKLRFATR